MSDWRHDDLAEDLASHLRGTTDRMVWTDMQLGPQGSPRPDVFTMPKSFHMLAMAYECKISVADFRSDVTSGKWQQYLQFAAGVYFAVPQGLITAKDLPIGAGLIIRTDTSWHAAKKPTLQRQPDLPRDAWMKLLMDGVKREVERAERTARPKLLNEWIVYDTIKHRYGAELAAALHDRDQAVAKLRQLQADSDAQIARALERQRSACEVASQALDATRAEQTQMVADLALALGLPADTEIWTLRNRMREAVNRLSNGGEAALLRCQLDAVKHALKMTEFPLPCDRTGLETALAWNARVDGSLGGKP